MELSNEQNQIEEQYDLMDIVYEVNGKKGIKDIKGKVRVPALYNDFAVLYADENALDEVPVLHWMD